MAIGNAAPDRLLALSRPIVIQGADPVLLNPTAERIGVTVSYTEFCDRMPTAPS